MERKLIEMRDDLSADMAMRDESIKSIHHRIDHVADHVFEENALRPGDVLPGNGEPADIEKALAK